MTTNRLFRVAIGLCFLVAGAFAHSQFGAIS
jgi:hypothetical protein